jgi:predicted TIM-barrel fold metal-dependent hydrolase
VCENAAVAIIDFHTHIFPPDVMARREHYLQRDRWFGQLYANPKARLASAEDLIASMDESGVDVSVAFGFAWTDPGLCRESNHYLLEAVSRWPGRIAGFAQVNPAAPGAVEELQRCMELGLHGLGELMPEGQGYSLDDLRLDDLVERMAVWQRPILIHAGEPVGHSYAGKSRCTLNAFYALAQRHPQATLVAAHWGGGLFFYELMPEVRQALANVYYDSAAWPLLYGDAIFSVAAQIAPHKALFGSDFPLLGQRALLQRVRACGLSAAVEQEMLGGNALRLLGIGGSNSNGAHPHLCSH